MKQLLRKALSMFLASVLLLGMFPAAYAAEHTGFSDTHGHWAEDAINRWSGYGVVQGNNGKFYPDNDMTRAEAATVFVKLLGLEQTADISAFTDVPAKAWYADAMAKCYAAGIFKGVAGNKLNPDGAITREMFFVMFARAMGIKEETELKKSFSDAHQLSDWAKGSVYALINHGYVNGVDDGSVIGGGRNINRASVMSLLDQTISDYQIKDGKPVITLKSEEKQETKPPVSDNDAGGYIPSVPATLIVSEENTTVNGGTYPGVIITSAVGNGEVILNNVTIEGNLTIQGGGSRSVKMKNCVVDGTVIMEKESGDAPRLELTNTPIAKVDVQNPAIIEATDSTSAVGTVDAKADVTVQGTATTVEQVNVSSEESVTLKVEGAKVENVAAETAVTIDANGNARSIDKVEAKDNVTLTGDSVLVDTIEIPASTEKTPVIDVQSGTVTTVEANKPAQVTSTTNSGCVSNVEANAAITVDSQTVDKVTVNTGTEITVEGTSGIEVVVETTESTSIITSNENISISTTQEESVDVVIKESTEDDGEQAHVHKWVEDETAYVAPTCKQEGSRTFRCSADNCPANEKTESIAKLPHTEVTDSAKAPTCTETGLTEGKHCSVCKTVITAQQVVDALGHTEVTDSAKAPTCTETGLTEGKHCSVCNTVIVAQQVVDALGHTEVTDSAKAPTCTETGLTEGKHCSVCNTVISAQQVVDALGHDFSGNYLKDNDGHWHKCSRCDATDTKQAHTWNDGEVTTPPTADTEGEKTFTCTKCGHTKTESIPAQGGEEEKVTAVPTGYKLKSDDNFGLVMTMTAPSEVEQEKIDVVNYKYTFGSSDQTAERNLAPSVTSSMFMTDYISYLSPGETTITVDVTSKPTNEAKAAGYTAGNTSFEVTAVMDGRSVGLDTSVTKATKSVDSQSGQLTLTVVGLKPNTLYNFIAHPTYGDPQSIIVKTTADGTSITHHTGFNYHVIELYELSFSNITDNSFKLDITSYGKINVVHPAQAAQGIVSMEHTGMYITIGMDAPENIENIAYFTLSFYDSSNKAESLMSEITCPANGKFFYVERSKFNPDFNYDKVEITSIAYDGDNAVWTGDVSVTLTEKAINASSYYDTASSKPFIRVAFNPPAPGFYHIGVLNNESVIENESSYSPTDNNGSSLYRGTIEAEDSVLASGNGQVVLTGWNITQLEQVSGKWTIAITKYIPIRVGVCANHNWDEGEVVTEPTETEAGSKVYTCTVCGATKNELLPATGGPEAGKILLVQNEGCYDATWKNYGYNLYHVVFTDSEGNNVADHYVDTLKLEGIEGLSPLPDTAGTYRYNIVLYGVNDDYEIERELAHLDNAFAVTVTEDVLSYDMSFNTPNLGKHTITFPQGAIDASVVGLLDAWYKANGNSAGRGCSIGDMSATTTKIESKGISDGMKYDLRMLYSLALEDQCLKLKISSKSMKTYTAPAATNTVQFTSLEGFPILNWDYAKPDCFENAHHLKLQFSTDNGASWTMEKEIYGKNDTSLWMSGDFMTAGHYNKLRMLLVSYETNQEVETEWFSATIDLEIVEEACTLSASFVPAEPNGYTATYSGLKANSFLNVAFTDDPSFGSMDGSGTSVSETTMTNTVYSSYIANGYYRLSLFRSATANGTTASVTMQQTPWIKCISVAE